ncbi:GGDEF domain-containing protein [Kineosporia rhizophila]|uniref:GGDEF domain-containing protein n=1 Tax=Kineosporia rhizophila TaxID=84633 RepID=UPI001E43F8C4|nr:GGDEF domain-containing protein [Kineosporia rhizophila]MCE0537141.1 GGDEF domain-containing protein [Kineosporia rhizophila]
MPLNQPILRPAPAPASARSLPAAALVVAAELAVTAATWLVLWRLDLGHGSLPTVLLAWGTCFVLYTAPVQDRLARRLGGGGHSVNLVLIAVAVWFALTTTELPSIYPVVIGALAMETAQRDSSTRTALVGLALMFGGAGATQFAVHQGWIGSLIAPVASDHLAVVMLAVGGVVAVRGGVNARHSASPRLALAQEQRLRHAELHYAATHDALTGLLSRRGLEPQLSAAGAQARPGAGVALLFLDLDGFKAINDSHGHAVGDELLAGAAVRFAQALGDGAALARMGGDEFVAVVPGVPSPAAAAQWARAVQESLDEPFRLGDQDGARDDVEVVVRVGVSVGLAYTDTPSGLGPLMRDADRAMYRQKRRRREIRLPEPGLASVAGRP